MLLEWKKYLSKFHNMDSPYPMLNRKLSDVIRRIKFVIDIKIVLKKT